MRAPVSGCSRCPPTRPIRLGMCSVPLWFRRENAGSPGCWRTTSMPAVVSSTRWREVAGPLAKRFPDSELADVAPEELSALPGIQEVLGLHEVGELAASGQWDHVVVDCASTADALRMLTLPATFGMYLERAWPRHRRLSIGADDARSAAVVELLE